MTGRDTSAAAAHGDIAALPGLFDDSDCQLRCIVAQRLPEGLLPRLPRLMRDADLQVRLEVARRVPMPALWCMATDRAAERLRMLRPVEPSHG